MTNFEKTQQDIRNMDIDELIEFCGGNSCENILCRLVGDDGFCYHGEHVAYECAKCIKTYLQKTSDG